MTIAPRRPPRWSKRTDELVRHVARRCRPGFQAELARWIESRPRFGDFIAANRDKARKKLTTADDEERRLDVRAELLVAYLLLADRRFELAFEAYGARRLGPDLTATFRTNRRFNLEVTRLRTTGDAGSAGGPPPAGGPVSRDVGSDPAPRDPGPSVARLATVIAGKLRQLPGDSPNALVIAAQGLALDEAGLVAAVRLLKLHADRKDDAFFARRGFKDARAFYAQYLQLGGIVLLDAATAPARARFSPNREARQPLPQEAVTALMRCLTSAGGTLHA